MRPFPRAEAEEEDQEEETADLYIYDVISSWHGVTAADFAKAMKGTKAKKINIRINSPGGDVFEARAIVAAIKEARRGGKNVTAYVDGLAASAASYVALAADRVVMERGAFLMIHNAWGFAIGNAEEMRDTAELLDKVDASIVEDYRAKTGEDEEQIRKWMAEETWFNAEEAMRYGFVDSITGEEDEEEDEDDAEELTNADQEGDEEEDAEYEPDEDPEDAIPDEDEEEDEDDEELGNRVRWNVAALSAYKRVPKEAKQAATRKPRKKKRRDTLIEDNERRLRILALCGA